MTHASSHQPPLSRRLRIAPALMLIFVLVVGAAGLWASGGSGGGTADRPAANAKQTRSGAPAGKGARASKQDSSARAPEGRGRSAPADPAATGGESRRSIFLIVFVATLLAAAAAALGIGRGLQRSVTEPLAALRDGARRLAAGEYSRPVGLNLGQEMDDVAVALNTTMNRLAEGQQSQLRQARLDQLTGLPNRSAFLANVERALSGRRPRGVFTTVLVLDIDDFKSINDTLGHAVGDQLLSAVGARLTGSSRKEDTVARLGGDEFAVMIENVWEPREAESAAQRLLASLGEPFPLDDREVAVHASLGVALGDSSDATNTDDLLRKAEVALYAAKAEQRGSYRIHDDGMQAQSLELVELEADLKRAIEAGELKLAYQPIVDLATGRVTSVEALLRWHRPGHGPINPLQFISVAEQTGLIVPLGELVLREACSELKHLRHEVPGGQGLRMHVNLSPKEFEQPDLVRSVAQILKETGTPAELITLEITETAMIEHLDSSISQLRSLKSLGVSLAIDDFGTGHSSLSYLQRLPIDILKIDKAFADAVAENSADRQLMEGMLTLGTSLNLEVVGEGIEEAPQAEALARMGCPRGQGYHFARPMDAEKLHAWLAERSGAANGSDASPAPSELDQPRPPRPVGTSIPPPGA